MKLYVTTGFEKVYLNLSALTRQDLRNKVGGELFQINGNLYRVSQVMAEQDSNNLATGSIVGGIIGALGGPAGILIGGIIGGFIGDASDDEEKRKISIFNASR